MPEKGKGTTRSHGRLILIVAVIIVALLLLRSPNILQYNDHDWSHIEECSNTAVINSLPILPNTNVGEANTTTTDAPSSSPTSPPSVSQHPPSQSSSSTSSSTIRTALQHHVNATNVAVLKQKMGLYFADRDNEEIEGTEDKEVITLLQIVTDQHMVPILRKVPLTEDLPKLPRGSFKGQEREDRHIYKRFFNEKTQQCHRFGSQLFESGAFEGVRLSNTYFFEKQFGLNTTLVEADDRNWKILVENVPKKRPLASKHKAALCPIGTESICMAKSRWNTMHSINLTITNNECEQSVPCFEFDESIHYALFSLDIEGAELDFLKMRHIHSDVVLIEVVQWARAMPDLITAVELIAYFAEHGYYLYEETIGFRNFVFLSQQLAHDCFADYHWD